MNDEYQNQMQQAMKQANNAPLPMIALLLLAIIWAVCTYAVVLKACVMGV